MELEIRQLFMVLVNYSEVDSLPQSLKIVY